MKFEAYVSKVERASAIAQRPLVGDSRRDPPMLKAARVYLELCGPFPEIDLCGKMVEVRVIEDDQTST